MSAEQNRTLARRFFDEVCNARKAAVADELFAPAHRYHDPSSPGTPAGPEGMKQLTATYYTAFRDAHWAIDEMVVTDELAVTRFTGTGTHTAPLMGIPPTGRRVSVQGIWIHRVQDGRIQESWNVWDTLGMLQQIGAVPALAAAQ